MDEDRLNPQLGRLIDAAKAAATRAGAEGSVAPAGSAPLDAGRMRAEGWAVLGVDGKVYSGTLPGIAPWQPSGTPARRLRLRPSLWRENRATRCCPLRIGAPEPTAPTQICRWW